MRRSTSSSRLRWSFCATCYLWRASPSAQGHLRAPSCWASWGWSTSKGDSSGGPPASSSHWLMLQKGVGPSTGSLTGSETWSRPSRRPRWLCLVRPSWPIHSQSLSCPWLLIPATTKWVVPCSRSVELVGSLWLFFMEAEHCRFQVQYWEIFLLWCSNRKY